MSGPVLFGFVSSRLVSSHHSPSLVLARAVSCHLVPSYSVPFYSVLSLFVSIHSTPFHPTLFHPPTPFGPTPSRPVSTPARYRLVLSPSRPLRIVPFLPDTDQHTDSTAASDPSRISGTDPRPEPLAKSPLSYYSPSLRHGWRIVETPAGAFRLVTVQLKA